MQLIRKYKKIGFSNDKFFGKHAPSIRLFSVAGSTVLYLTEVLQLNSHFLTYQDSLIHYRYSGEGPKTVLCFHGFGTFARTFDWLAAHVPGHIFIAFDLPYHGETRWNNGEMFTPADMLRIIDLCPHVKSESFGLMGYSMGGRICLQLVQEIPGKINNLVLLAPDGLHANPWYRLATRTRIGNLIFRRVMKEPRSFIRVLRRAASVGLVNKGVVKFVDRYLENDFVRRQVYRVWTSFRKFRPDLELIPDLLVKHGIPVSLIYGRYDTIIPLAPGERFFLGLKGKKRFDVLESGHQILHVRNAPYIAEAFNHDA